MYENKVTYLFATVAIAEFGIVTIYSTSTFGHSTIV